MAPPLLLDFARWAENLVYDDIPAHVTQKARLQMQSVLGAIYASSNHDLGQLVTRTVVDMAGQGPCSLIPSGRKLDLISTVWAHSALSLALDYDDYLLFGHTGHSAVCVSLAAGDFLDLPLQSCLTAQIIANEIEGRLGAAVVLGPHNGQAWSHIHLAGAAAAAAKLMGLSANKIANAVAIALYQPTYPLWPGFMGPDSKVLTAATPTVAGVQAAFFASQGASGALPIVEHPAGLLATLSFVPAPFFLSGFGTAWTTDTLAFKLYPGCAYLDTTIDAILDARRAIEARTGLPFEPRSLDHVCVEASFLTVGMDRLRHTGRAGASNGLPTAEPPTPIELNFSVPGTVALALLHGDVRTSHLRRESLERDSEVLGELSSKVVVEHDWSLTLDLFRALDQVLDLRSMVGSMSIRGVLKALHRMRRQYGGLGQLGMDRKAFGALMSNLGALALSPNPKAQSQKPNTPYDLGDCALERFTMPFSSRVTIRSTDGVTVTRQRDVPMGGPGHEPQETQRLVSEKLIREATGVIGEEAARDLLRAIDDSSHTSARHLMGRCVSHARARSRDTGR